LRAKKKAFLYLPNTAGAISRTVAPMEYDVNKPGTGFAVSCDSWLMHRRLKDKTGNIKTKMRQTGGGIGAKK